MSMHLRTNARRIIALLTIIAIGFSCRVAAAGQTGPRYPLKYSGPAYHGTTYATSEYRVSVVRAGPSKTAKLIGYLPGAVRIGVELNHTKGAWIRIAPFPIPVSWGIHGPMWVQRTRLAMQADYRPFKGDWPLSYIRFTTEDTNALWVFPPGNRCTERFIKNKLPKIAKSAYADPKQTSCQELWAVPGTHLVYASPNYGPNNNANLDFWKALTMKQTDKLVFGDHAMTLQWLQFNNVHDIGKARVYKKNGVIYVDGYQQEEYKVT